MKNLEQIKDFDSISLKLASPDVIKGWSYGEITKPETINYRTGRSEKCGLFDERIFGPEKDYECYCGKYRRIRYKGIVCEKCGVEVTRSIVRRERMGHIELAAPVSHIWFLRGIPSRIGLILGLSIADLEKVVYFAGYIITKVNESEKVNILKELDTEYKTKVKNLSDKKAVDKLKELLLATKKEIGEIQEGKVLDEIVYRKFSLRYGSAFEAGIGAEAIHNIFLALDLEKMKDKVTLDLEKSGAANRIKIQKRLRLVKAMIKSGVRPEWMFLTVIPVIPPALRPMVALEGGRHATSDVNDLYRRVINRNNRLKKLKDIGAPDVILRNEKRILQEAVDALIDNSIRKQSEVMSAGQANRRSLKSLADVLKGKQGIFRQNLLGKRVDYSARSVIVVGPTLKLDQCGLPKHMALELFRPFVISKLLEKELAFNIRGAGRLIDEGIPEVWAILEKVIENKYVLLNRAPTLHRLGIQAFKPILIEGNAIQVHPLVCTAFNADFDGDQMAVHLPLSDEAQREAREIMSSAKNLLKPGNGDPIVTPSLDIVLGCYWMTKFIDGDKGEGKIFPNPNSAIMAYDFGKVGFRSKIKVMATDTVKYEKFAGQVFETSVGRLLFNSVLPKDYPFLDKEIDKKSLADLTDDLIMTYGVARTPDILDKIKTFGYKYVTTSGITWGMDDVIVPEEKKEMLKEGGKLADEIRGQFNEGLLSEEERYRKTIEVWQRISDEVGALVPGKLVKDGSSYDMLNSGARGSASQIAQMAGMKGLIINPKGRVIDFPVTPSYKEGLSPLEYFITTHGARKGLADTALQTARAGYLTRRLVDVAQNAIITEEDCKTKKGKIAIKQILSGLEISLAKSLRGRITAAAIENKKGEKLYPKGHLITKADALEIEELGIEEVLVRSPLLCDTVHGLCQKCYGVDLSRNMLVALGEPVGIVAAQAIGEPGTQLTMRTFHSGGIASVGGDITMGLPRVEEIFERRIPKSAALIAKTDGIISEIKDGEKGTIVTIMSDAINGTKGNKTTTKAKKGKEANYVVPAKRLILVAVGDKVKKGQFMTDGSADLTELFKYASKEVAEEYIISEINKVYELQGASISRKHIEVIIRQMFSRMKIKEIGDTPFTVGEVVSRARFIEEGAEAENNGGEKSKADNLIMGISEVSATTDSWLSSASFQYTTRILIDNAIRGGVDHLRGLKENVIVGRLIPAGTGFNADSEEEDEDNSEEEDKK